MNILQQYLIFNSMKTLWCAGIFGLTCDYNISRPSAHYCVSCVCVVSLSLPSSLDNTPSPWLSQEPKVFERRPALEQRATFIKKCSTCTQRKITKYKTEYQHHFPLSHLLQHKCLRALKNAKRVISNERMPNVSNAFQHVASDRD